MKRFVYLHPVLAVLLPLLPCVAVMGVLCFYRVMTLPLLFFFTAWLLLLFTLPVRRAFPLLMADASRKLQEQCDVQGFLAVMDVLRAKKHLPTERRLLIEANYALGLDAGGYTDEAMACLCACGTAREAVSPYVRYQLDMAYACVCAHAEQARAELPNWLSMLEQGFSTIPFPPPVREMLRRNLDNLQDIAQYHRGDYDGLRERFVARIEAYRDRPGMRRGMLMACLWLARVYEKEGSMREAAAMYRYVVENGNTLGAVNEAKQALASFG
ncbi:MAG: hypothetical protein IJY20_00085 [Clostridia bacterium]|nr:hypothetical protein [Clostridia bacterium]